MGARLTFFRHGYDTTKRRNAVNRERENEELIELGAASAETKGPTVGKDDHAGGFILQEGLSDE
jgi:predicted lactoylglutathione lyase